MLEGARRLWTAIVPHAFTCIRKPDIHADTPPADAVRLDSMNGSAEWAQQSYQDSQHSRLVTRDSASVLSSFGFGYPRSRVQNSR